MHSSRTQYNGVESTPKVRIGCRMYDALGHSRGRLYRGSIPAAQDAPASSLWGSGGCQPTHPEAHSVVAHVLDGLWAVGSIS